MDGSVRVELQHSLDILQRILLHRCPLGGRSAGSEDGLDFIGLEDSLKIGVGHDGSWHAESLLVCRAVDGVKSIESSSSPNAETSNVSTGGKFEEIEFVDGEEGNAGDVAESKRDTLILLVNNKGAAFLDTSSVSHFSASGSEASGRFDTLDVIPGSDLSEDTDSVLSFFQGLDGVIDDKGKFGDFLNRVTFGHGESGDGGGSNGRASGITSLGHVDLAVPSAPGLVGVKHATSSAHVSESGSTGSGGTTTTNTGNTGNSATGTPGLRRGLFAGVRSHGIWGSVVLGDVSVNKVDNIWSDWRLEDCWEVNGLP